MMGEGFIELILQNSYRRLDAVQFKDEEYREKHLKTEEMFQKLEEMKLMEEQSRAVNDLLTACNEENSVCCKIMYRQGIMDCVEILKEIGIIRM